MRLWWNLVLVTFRASFLRGAELNGAFWRAGLIDRVMMFIAPKIVGGDGGKGVFKGQGALTMTEATVLTDVRVTHFGDDILIEGEVATCSPD